MKRTELENSVRHCYSSWADRYYDDYYASEQAYPPVHVDIARNILLKYECQSLLDAGCGPASMLRHLDWLGQQRYGFDLTAEMVVEAKRILSADHVPEQNIWQGSVMDQAAFSNPEGSPALQQGYDAVLCFGVLPHIPEAEECAVFANLKQAVRPGGIVLVEARNELFGLFTLNRYSRALFSEHLIREEMLKERAGPDERTMLESALLCLDKQFRMDLPPIRTGYADEPGYDEILSRTHNPFITQKLAEACGFEEVQLLFYHYHALPPMLESMVPDLFRRESVRIEDPTDWRGYFMASAFILVGRCPA